jgi:hypothetical protein
LKVITFESSKDLFFFLVWVISDSLCSGDCWSERWSLSYDVPPLHGFLHFFYL